MYDDMISLMDESHYIEGGKDWENAKEAVTVTDSSMHSQLLNLFQCLSFLYLMADPRNSRRSKNTQNVITQLMLLIHADDLDEYGHMLVMPSSEQSNVVNHSETEITSDSNIIPYSYYVLKEGQNVDLKSNDNVLDSSAQSVEIDRLKQTLSEHLKEKESLMQTVSLLKDDFKNKAQQLELKLYVGNVSEKTNSIVIPDSEETLLLAEESPNYATNDEFEWDEKAANDEIQVSAVGLTFYWHKLTTVGSVNAVRLNLVLLVAVRLNLIQALVDKKKVIITETSIRRDLQLSDENGTECLPNATIFTKLERIGAKTTDWNEFSSTMASVIICLDTNQKFNFSKYIFDNMVKNLEGGVKFLMYPRTGARLPLFSVTTHSNDPLLSGEDILKLNELMKLYTNLSQRVIDLENTKTSQAAEITKLKERVKKLDRRNKSRIPGLKRLRNVGRTARIKPSEDEDEEVSFIDETQGRNDDNLMFDTGVLDEQKVEVEKTLIEIKAAKPKAVTTAATTTTTAVTRPKARGVVVQEPSEFTTTTSPS
ncbi:hypothetical protein Tco_1319074 [Tanacetum coccineum]